AVGDAVALPRRDRRRARPEGEGAGGVRLPLPGGRVDVRALPRPPDDLPARLPRRPRLPAGPLRGARRARPPRARRPPAGGGGQARDGDAPRQAGVRAGASACAATVIAILRRRLNAAIVSS